MASRAAAFDSQILDLVMAAMSDMDDGCDVWQRVFAELEVSFDITLGGVLDVIGPGLDVAAVAVWPARAASMRVTAEENRAYPLIRHYGRRPDALPRTLDDVLDECGWRTSARFARMRRQFEGARHHFMLPLRRSVRSVRLFGVARSGGNFTTSEWECVRRLQHVLEALDRHQETISTWRAACLPHSPDAAGRVAAHGITPRELTVLALLAEGLTVTTAGRRLGISPRTIAKHQENLQRKLDTTDRLNTVLRAQQLGLVPAGHEWWAAPPEDRP